MHAYHTLGGMLRIKVLDVPRLGWAGRCGETSDLYGLRARLLVLIIGPLWAVGCYMGELGCTGPILIIIIITGYASYEFDRLSVV